MSATILVEHRLKVLIAVPQGTKDELVAQTLANEIASFEAEHRHKNFTYLPFDYRIAYVNGGTESVLVAVLAMEE